MPSTFDNQTATLTLTRDVSMTSIDRFETPLTTVVAVSGERFRRLASEGFGICFDRHFLR